MEREGATPLVVIDVSAQIRKEPVAEPSLHGCLRVLMQFDVCEEIRLDQLREIIGARTMEPSFKHPPPGYVRCQRPPVLERIESVALDTGERLEAQIKYCEYVIVSVIF